MKNLKHERGAKISTKPLKNSMVKLFYDNWSFDAPEDVQEGALSSFLARCGPRGGDELRNQRRRNFVHGIKMLSVHIVA